MIDSEKELSKLLKKLNDEKLVQEFKGNIQVYESRLFNARDHEDILLLKQELKEYFAIPCSWKQEPIIYNVLKRDFKIIEEFKSMLESMLINAKRAAPKDFENLNSEIKEELKDEREDELKYERKDKLKYELKCSGRHDVKIHEQLQAQHQEKYIPSISDILDYFNELSHVGDIPVKLLSTLAVSSRLCFGIEGFSGAGKTSTLDKVLELFPEEDIQVINFASSKSLSYIPCLSNKKILVFSELQKAACEDTIEEILKDLGEGKSARRIVTSKDHSGVEVQVIDNQGSNKKAVIYTKAVENRYKKDAELSRRYFVLHTDAGRGQTVDVIKKLAENEFKNALSAKNENAEMRMNPETLKQLKAHLKECLYMPDQKYANPFAEYLAAQMPPRTITRTFCQHYFHLINASAKFHHTLRMAESIDEKNRIFVSIHDIYLVHSLYHRQFIKSVLKLPFYGEKVIEVLEMLSQQEFTRQSGEGQSGEGSRHYGQPAEKIYRQLKKTEPELSFEFVRASLERLADAGVIEKSSYSSKSCTYFMSEKMELKQEISWNELWKNGVENMANCFNTEFVSKWIKSQTIDGKLYLRNPYTGETAMTIAVNNQ